MLGGRFPGAVGRGRLSGKRSLQAGLEGGQCSPGLPPYAAPLSLPSRMSVRVLVLLRVLGIGSCPTAVKRPVV